MPTLALHDAPAAFLALVRDHLEAREGENGLLLGFLAALAAKPPAEAPFLARLATGGETVAAAYLTSLNLIASRGMGQAADDLVRALLAAGRTVPGVVGPPEDVDALVDAWCRATGHRPGATIAQGLYELRAIDWPTGIPGAMRAMTDADVDRVAAWLLGFHHDALPHEPYAEAAARANAQARPAQGMTYLWEVDGVAVAMAALARPTRRGITVNAVYTPPGHRRRGYASALVAQLSAEGLARGKDFCVLYTDLANPTSNAIYQRIGYRRVASSKNVRLEASP